MSQRLIFLILLVCGLDGAFAEQPPAPAGPQAFQVNRADFKKIQDLRISSAQKQTGRILAPGEEDKAFFSVLGEYQRPGWTLFWNDRKVDVGKNGKFVLEMSPSSEETQLGFMAIGPMGEVERESVGVHLPIALTERKSLDLASVKHPGKWIVLNHKSRKWDANDSVCVERRGLVTCGVVQTSVSGAGAVAPVTFDALPQRNEKYQFELKRLRWGVNESLCISGDKLSTKDCGVVKLGIRDKLETYKLPLKERLDIIIVGADERSLASEPEPAVVSAQSEVYQASPKVLPEGSLWWQYFQASSLVLNRSNGDFVFTGEVNWTPQFVIDRRFGIRGNLGFSGANQAGGGGIVPMLEYEALFGYNSAPILFEVGGGAQTFLGQGTRIGLSADIAYVFAQNQLRYIDRVFIGYTMLFSSIYSTNEFRLGIGIAL